MNLFQWVTISVLVVLAILEFRAYVKNHRPIHLLRELVWLTGILLILFPAVASFAASALGIGRGTDLVFYVFMLLCTGAMFYLYGRNYVLRRDLVELARRDAMRSAIAGTGLEDDEREPGWVNTQGGNEE